MSGRFFHIADIGEGKLTIGPRPPADDLAGWVGEAREQGVDIVVSLITKPEIARYGLGSEKTQLDALGIAFVSFPVDDFDIPDAGAFEQLITDLTAHLQQGQHIFAHCAGGVGRAGTLASCLLVRDSWDADEAMAHVSDKRGCASPENDKQRDFVSRFGK